MKQTAEGTGGWPRPRPNAVRREGFLSGLAAAAAEPGGSDKPAGRTPSRLSPDVPQSEQVPATHSHRSYPGGRPHGAAALPQLERQRRAGAAIPEPPASPCP